jgi:hypothetical protein
MPRSHDERVQLGAAFFHAGDDSVDELDGGGAATADAGRPLRADGVGQVV